MNKSDSKSTSSDNLEVDGLFNVYFEYNKILRTWFVAFGIGGPATFLVNTDIAKALNDAGSLECVALLFLGGAGAQVLGALINKIGSWYEYFAANTEEDGPLYTFAIWLMHQFWIDILVDLITIAAFGTAVWKMMVILGSAR